MRIIYLTSAHFPTSCVKEDRRPKNWKIWLATWGPLLGIGPKNFAHFWRSQVSNILKNLAARYQKWGEILGGPKIYLPQNFSKSRGYTPKIFTVFERAYTHLLACRTIRKSVRQGSHNFWSNFGKFWQILGARRSPTATARPAQFCYNRGIEGL